MARQKEERRRKLAEERQAQAMASNERQKKLQELYDTQRKRVEVNLRHKQKKREEYAKSLASRGLHIHLHDPTSSSNVSQGVDAYKIQWMHNVHVGAYCRPGFESV